MGQVCKPRIFQYQVRLIRIKRMRIFLPYKVKLFLQHLRKGLLCVQGMVYLFLSGTITLKTIFKYFKFYLSKVRKYIYPFNEKPSWRLLKKDRIFTVYFNLCHWYFTHQSRSMAQVLYAQEPRDPE